MGKYVDTKELERTWTSWNETHDQAQWDQLSLMVYRICNGVSTHFNPRDDDELLEHTHDATTALLSKIYEGKLRFTPGRAPVFNLLTTTAFNLLYSKMNKNKRAKEKIEQYRQRIVNKFIEPRSITTTQSFDEAPVTSFNGLPLDRQVPQADEFQHIYDRYKHTIPGTAVRESQLKRVSVEIACCQCGARRRVYTCDLFHVTRCKNCASKRIPR